MPIDQRFLYVGQYYKALVLAGRETSTGVTVISKVSAAAEREYAGIEHRSDSPHDTLAFEFQAKAAVKLTNNPTLLRRLSID